MGLIWLKNADLRDEKNAALMVIARGGKVDVLCGDHRPYGKSKTALEEIKRIRHAGGWISNGRVCGILSVSRAFGDIKLKTLRQEMLEEGVKTGLWTSKFASRSGWITREGVCGLLWEHSQPEVLHFPSSETTQILTRGNRARHSKILGLLVLLPFIIFFSVRIEVWGTSPRCARVDLNGDWVTAAPDVNRTVLEDADFIILASDGLWDYIQSSEAVLFVRDQLHQHGDVQRACEALAKLALDKNGQDNVSVVIADFGKVQYDPNALEDSNVSADAGQLVLVLGLVGLGIWLSQFASHAGLF
ncbi:hypothetical protein L7F22_002648 [Adiantum nelumboides]|nr:hypothetical protein [Adiantum nelumboides]